MSAEKPLAYQKTDNEIAEIEDPRDAAVTQPWSPDPEKRPGTPPVQGQDGERGSYAFPGTELFKSEAEEANAGFIPDVRPDTHYPLHGVDYWEGSTPTGNHSGTGRETYTGVEGAAEPAS